jgi:hypothetical protein
MRRTLVAVSIFCMLLPAAAFAGRGHRGGPRGGGGGRVIVRDHRAPAPAVRDHRAGRGPVVVRDRRPGPRGHRHVRVVNGRYMFPGGVVRVYKRPHFHRHYYDRRVRPPIIVEAYDPVPGYVWVAGSWTWGGGEWVWTPGYWAVAEAPPPPPQPVVRGGISISGGISIH